MVFALGVEMSCSPMTCIDYAVPKTASQCAALAIALIHPLQRYTYSFCSDINIQNELG